MHRIVASEIIESVQAFGRREHPVGIIAVTNTTRFLLRKAVERRECRRATVVAEARFQADRGPSGVNCSCDQTRKSNRNIDRSRVGGSRCAAPRAETAARILSREPTSTSVPSTDSLRTTVGGSKRIVLSNDSLHSSSSYILASPTLNLPQKQND